MLGADQVVWQQQQDDDENSGVYQLELYSADGDDDGDVDADDLQVWQDHYGNFMDLIGVTASS